MDDLLIKIFCDVDDFCNNLEKHLESKLLAENTDIQKPILFSCKTLSLSEVMAIIVYFHHSKYRTFKDYYTKYIKYILKSYFPKAVSYNRFVELIREALIPLIVYTKKFKLGRVTGISFIDSTTLDVCHNRRIHSHKVFKGIAQRGKSSTGWFFGFKLHIAINDKGEILEFFLTPGDTDDRNKKVIDVLTKDLFGKLFGDKGYLSKDLFERLFDKGIQLVTKIKKNMKNKLMLLEDKLLLRKRAIIESLKLTMPKGRWFLSTN